ncbi:MAG: bifunctional 23S rRNA (guanine(2069)-N(7))-methyltransferase RlmK/23S rRNA (guanine(2445)-N(2))-methyltransferase RlmL, partial [Cellvibrionaceae bacterium]|nr:bifunctional 23S rRNA (guanine(2069)-N(7))-methyltransferase RlmK/23S rRNA (guanine(2445)-N(2))-methyltransferase RlmL [Cellvibrionaceae bacterium]
LEQLGHLYRELGDKLKEYFNTWRAGVFTGNPQLGKTMGLRASKRYKLFNGALASELLMFEVQADNFVDAPPQNLSPRQELTEGIFFASCTEAELSNGAQMVLNRLRKNIKPLKKWAEQRQIDCYRVYDADMPEYSAAIDYYAGHWHVQEYQAPASVKEDKAQGRLQELVDALVVGFELNPEQIFIKQRRRQSGKAQYEKRGGNRYRDEVSRSKIVVQEGSARFAVNLWDYLDSGVFLDHRPVRKMVGELAAGKRLLNLFCYTGTVTVQAALAGARSSVSVDMSRTYISWCRENFGLNNIHEAKHELVQADCFDYLKQCREAFDVIMLDPPSFSNSKRMDNTLDIQRDHVALLRRCMDLLKPGGVLVFSNNLRSFKLDDEGLAPYAIEDISPRTIDKDFQRRPNIHQCWLLRHQ